MAKVVWRMKRLTCPHGITPKSTCRECNRERVRQWQLNHPDRMREFRYRYRQTHRLKIREYNKQYFQTHRDACNKRKLASRNRHLDRARTRGLAWRNTSLGSRCLLCGSNEKLERHHTDYSKPLEIVTLCRSCHLEEKFEKIDGSLVSLFGENK